MINIKLYEEFSSSKKAEFTEILPKIAELFPDNEEIFSDPKSFLGKNSWQIGITKKIFKGKIDAPKVFGEILDILISGGYEFKSIPNTNGLAGKDLKRFSRVYYSLNFSSIYGDEDQIIVIPTEYEGKKYCFTIILGKKITEIGLYVENALTDLMIIGSSHFNVLKSVILDNGDLVEARFILDDLIPPARRSEENYVGQYISTGSSNGKKYRLEMAIVKEYYSDVIDDILPEEGVEIEVITK